MDTLTNATRQLMTVHTFWPSPSENHDIRRVEVHRGDTAYARIDDLEHGFHISVFPVQEDNASKISMLPVFSAEVSFTEAAGAVVENMHVTVDSTPSRPGGRTVTKMWGTDSDLWKDEPSQTEAEGIAHCIRTDTSGAQISSNETGFLIRAWGPGDLHEFGGGNAECLAVIVHVDEKGTWSDNLRVYRRTGNDR